MFAYLPEHVILQVVFVFAEDDFDSTRRYLKKAR